MSFRELASGTIRLLHGSLRGSDLLRHRLDHSAVFPLLEKRLSTCATRRWLLAGKLGAAQHGDQVDDERAHFLAVLISQVL